MCDRLSEAARGRYAPESGKVSFRTACPFTFKLGFGFENPGSDFTGPQKPNPRASLKVDGPLRCSNLSSLSRVAPLASFQKAGYNLALGMLNNACRLASSASRLNLRIRTPKAPECAQTEVCPPFSASKPPDLHTPGACVCAGGRFTSAGGLIMV